MSSFTEPETGNWTWSPGVQWVCDYAETSVSYMLLKAITNGKISFSPLDIKKFTHHNKGAMFGLDIQKADNPELSPRSGMKNLFFTGEDIFAHGLTPLNGVITASVVTGKNLIKRFKKVYKTKYRQ